MNTIGSDSAALVGAVADEAAGPKPAPGIPVGKRSRASRLVEQLVGSGAFSESELADAIVVTRETLESYRSGRVKIPLERQLCIALLAIERAPAARRAGFALRAQVEAEIAVAATRTETHDSPPVCHRWP